MGSKLSISACRSRRAAATVRAKPPKITIVVARGEAEVLASIADVALPREMLELAEHIVDAKSAHFPALQDLFKQTPPQRKKQAVEHAPSDVINLIDALRRSMRSIIEDKTPQPTRRRN